MPTLRLPTGKTRWVWKMEDDMGRLLIEVDSVTFVDHKHGWVIRSMIKPERPLALSGLPIPTRPHVCTLDDFWDNVTPVGGRLEDLSKPISEEQYRPMIHNQGELT